MEGLNNMAMSFDMGGLGGGLGSMLSKAMGKATSKPKAPAPTPKGSIFTNAAKAIAPKAPAINYAPWQAPAAQAPAQQSYGMSAPIGGGGGYMGGGGGVGTGGNAGISAPPMQSYSMDDPNDRIAQADSTFRGQESLYNESLKKFLADITRRKQTLEKDTNQAREGIGRNRELGLTGMGEDFAARGLGHSGLWVDAQKKGMDSYTRQDNNVLDAKTTGDADLEFSASKETADNGARVQAAKRDALYRLSLKNNLVTGL